MTRNDIIKNYQKQLLLDKEKALSENQDIIESFINYCKNKKIEVNQKDFDYKMGLGIICNHQNIINKLNSNIKKDSEGLVNFNMLTNQYSKKRFSEGLLFASNYVIFADSLFRRGYSSYNNFTPRFIDHFWNQNFENNDSYILLDFDRVKVDINGPSLLEEDTWYGAAFNKDISLIKDGVTQLRPPQYLDDFENEFLFKSAYSLDIMWYSYDSIKVFQALEFKTQDITIEFEGQTCYPVRYIHAEFDINLSSFRHFDGAIQFYSEEEYYSRRDENFNQKVKGEYQLKSKSKKLFKINKEFSSEDWVKFTSHFFVQNPLILEYFAGQYPKQTEITLDALRKSKNIES